METMQMMTMEVAKFSGENRDCSIVLFSRILICHSRKSSVNIKARATSTIHGVLSRIHMAAMEAGTPPLPKLHSYGVKTNVVRDPTRLAGKQHTLGVQFVRPEQPTVEL